MLRMAIRTDANAQIGMGHLMRCLTLAEELQRQVQAEIGFVCNRDLPADIHRELKHRGYQVKLQPHSRQDFSEQADAQSLIAGLHGHRMNWIIVDHYGISERWEKAVRPYTDHIAVIDDLADRAHDCDVLLDQNLYPNLEHRYDALVPMGCKLLLGPAHILLREEFRQWRDYAKVRTACRHILVNFGGSDPTNEMGKVVSVIRNGTVPPNVHFHLVAGPANPRREAIRSQCAGLSQVTYYSEVRHMAKLLSGMDLAIGAGGISLWERCYMGVPTIIITVADNQKEAALEASRQGLVWYLGESREVSGEQVAHKVTELAEDPGELVVKSERALFFTEPLRNKDGMPMISIMKNS